GHRGANQPVTATGTGRTYITTQNHGYEVIADTVKEGIVSYVNANDGSCEGVDYPEKHAFSVQFHPEACAGPHDTEFLFDRFIALMKEGIGHAEG
ncbi:MAG: carbamoyl phosphate synthase small subunit, partial [Clostridia bacterium]|nr:carbamoyl phosphate synthase small subunit [Clostridia bacterium]